MVFDVNSSETFTHRISLLKRKVLLLKLAPMFRDILKQFYVNLNTPIFM